MTVWQIAGLATAGMMAAWAAWQSLPARPRAEASLDACARDALSLAARLRGAGCPEGVAACQRLLNVILEHPAHEAPEVQS